MASHNSLKIALPTHRPEPTLEPLAVVSERHDLDALAKRLHELRAWLADDLTSLDEAIAKVADHGKSELDAAPLLDGGPLRVARSAEHLLLLPGKRIRALCVLLAARLGGVSLNPKVRDLAVACELVHAATLLHDDVIDDSRERRSAPAARVLFGNSASILAGDHLLVEALRLVRRTGHETLLDGILNVISTMVQAEALQLERRGRFTPNRELYLHVIRGKTAALFDWGLQAGAVCADLPQASVETLSRVGAHLGMAFQLVDDLLDLDGDSQATGKDALVDLREGKLTWPMILAAERDASVADDLAAFTTEDKDWQGPEIRNLIERVRATGAIRDTRLFALENGRKACVELEQLPDGEARRALVWVVESAVHRAR